MKNLNLQKKKMALQKKLYFPLLPQRQFISMSLSPLLLMDTFNNMTCHSVTKLNSISFKQTFKANKKGFNPKVRIKIKENILK